MGVSKLSAKQPWTAIWTPGVNLVNFFNLYDNKGNVTISAPTSIASTLDGPIQVARYGALTVNGGLTTAQRCRGLIVLSDSLTMGAGGHMSMTARGAAGASNWAVDKDIFVPQSITFTGKNTSYADFLKWIRQTGYCIFDPSMYACPPQGMGDVQCDWATWTPHGSAIVSAAGCGVGIHGVAIPAGSSFNGSTGEAGTNGGAGSGGRGGVSSAVAGATASSRSAPGTPWGGGPGGAGIYAGSSNIANAEPDMWGGRGGDSKGNGAAGGGAGNPGGTGVAPGLAGGNGTGGVLASICRGAVALAAGHLLSSLGSAGGDGVGAGSCGGGGSGGGPVSLLFGGALTGTPNLLASGGPAGTGAIPGGPGAAGSTQAKTFAQMGWS
ncbi:hypothetical protein [Solidesulfovibrio sp.]